jgi:hypothetical protein
MTSHATIASGHAYYEVDTDSTTIHLLTEPRPTRVEIEVITVSITHAALLAYQRLQPDAILTSKFEVWNQRVVELGELLTVRAAPPPAAK